MGHPSKGKESSESSASRDDKGENNGEERVLPKGMAIVKGEDIVSLPQQPPCPLVTALSLATALPFVIPSKARDLQFSCRANKP
jgi:hypothetical protein